MWGGVPSDGGETRLSYTRLQGMAGQCLPNQGGRNTSLKRCQIARTGGAVSLLSSLALLSPPIPSAAEVCVVVWPALELLLLPYGS